MKYLSKINLENFLLLIWIAILLSINSIDLDLINFNKEKFNFNIKYFYIFINFIRFISPFIVLPILILIFIITKKKINNWLTVVFSFYIIWQIIIFLLLGIKNNLLNNIQLVSSGLAVLLILYLADQNNYKKFYKQVLIITLIFISIISFYITYNILIEKYFLGLKYVYGTNVLDPTKQIFFQPPPRITGISRLLVLIFFLFFLITIKINKIFFKIPLYLFLISLTLIIYIMQARGSFIGLIIIYLFYFFFDKRKFLNKLFFFITIFLLPILLYEGIYFKKQYDLNKNLELKKTRPNRLLPEYNFKSDKIQYFSSSSGRKYIWEVSFNLIKEKKILLGYGPQADRLLLSEYAMINNPQNIYIMDDVIIIFDNNSSNGLIYSYLCGGIIGLTLLVIIYIMLIKEIYKTIFKRKFIFNEEILLTFSIITLTFLILRTVYENGFSVFGLDFILILIIHGIIYQKNNLTKNY
jgi:O-antigen ligase